MNPMAILYDHDQLYPPYEEGEKRKPKDANEVIIMALYELSVGVAELISLLKKDKKAKE